MTYLRYVTVIALTLLLMAIALGAVPVLGPSTMPRQLYLKLPLEQPRFHWRFDSEEKLLAGTLTVRITGRDGRATEHVVFDGGELSPTWRVLGKERDDGAIYFGFRSREAVVTGPEDSVSVELVVPEDLPGIGSYRQGVLPAGRHTASASYSLVTGGSWQSLFMGSGEPTAFIGCWREVWPLEITAAEGWNGPTPAPPSRLRASYARLRDRLDPERGTDGSRCVK